MKVEETTAQMFAQAVVLAQNGKMKSTIHCEGNEIFIMNMDNTLLFRFLSKQAFPAACNFFANDYEGSTLNTKDGKIEFVTCSNGVRRSKLCPSPKTTIKDVKAYWTKVQESGVNKDFVMSMTKDMANMLQDDLSHVEFRKNPGENFKILQRDIYSGTKIEVEKIQMDGGMFDSADDTQIPVIGIRTCDLMALFTFTDSLNFHFQPGARWVYIDDYSGRVQCLLSTCLYDELGIIEKVEG